MGLALAFWVADQQQKGITKLLKKKEYKKNDPDIFYDRYAFTLLGAPYIAALGASPYWRLAKRLEYEQGIVNYSNELIRNRHIMKAQAKVGIKPKMSSQLKHMTIHYKLPAKITGKRVVAAKLASRLIPYVGWALLASDIYSIGKMVQRRL